MNMNCVKDRPTSNYKRCCYCMSDFKQSLAGDICPKCRELEAKFGGPRVCSICTLKAAFGSGMLCQRCSHYQTKFGDAVDCEHCHKKSAFYKDEESRIKVGNQVLCFLCTYDYKLDKARQERQQQRFSRKRTMPSDAETKDVSASDESVKSLAPVAPPPTKVSITSSYLSNTSATTSSSYKSVLSKSSLTAISTSLSSSNSNSSILSGISSSVTTNFSDPRTTIQHIMEEGKELQRKLSQKERDLLAKMRETNILKGEMEDMKEEHRGKVDKLQLQLETERANYRSQLEKLRKENAALMKSVGKKKRASHFPPLATADIFHNVDSNSPV